MSALYVLIEAQNRRKGKEKYIDNRALTVNIFKNVCG